MNCWPTMPVAPRIPTGIVDIAAPQKKSRHGLNRVGMACGSRLLWLTFERHTSDTVAGPLSAGRSHVGCEPHTGGVYHAENRCLSGQSPQAKPSADRRGGTGGGVGPRHKLINARPALPRVGAPPRFPQ